MVAPVSWATIEYEGRPSAVHEGPQRIGLGGEPEVGPVGPSSLAKPGKIRDVAGEVLGQARGEVAEGQSGQRVAVYKNQGRPRAQLPIGELAMSEIDEPDGDLRKRVVVDQDLDSL